MTGYTSLTALRQLWNFISGPSIKFDLGERHQPSGYDDRYHYASTSIESYLASARQQVAAARTDLNGAQDDWVIEGNSPFVLQPGSSTQRAILMVHGLTDCPYGVRDLARFFQKQGFYVLAMQLPGHGTRPGDLLDIRWQDWARAHQHQFELLKSRFKQVYALGFSAGAALSIHQSVLNPDIDGLFLFSPAIRVSPLARLAGVFARAGRQSRRMAWFDVQPDTDCFKYESLTNRGIAEAYAMTRSTQRLSELSEHRMPVFVAVSEHDATLDSQATLDWFEQLAGPRRLLYYTTGTAPLPDYSRRVTSVLPDQKIQSFSHTSIIQSPDNPHYGRHGSQRVCTHYYRADPLKYARCRAGEEDCLGEMFQEAADCQVVRRLTYNPLYDELLAEISQFINQHLDCP